ncbi:MAG TPA: hypothetical protein VI911_08190 [Patescibacteria group bacterium]|nr:hypothetical protein [Patescibacteria group bacterium]
MLVAELVLRKLQTQDEIKELENYISRLQNITGDRDSLSKMYKECIIKLFNLYDQLQSQKVVLKKCNTDNHIIVDSNKINITDALEIAATLESRLNLYTTLINSDTMHIDILSIMKDRASLLEDYLKLIRYIKANDWSTEVG